MAGGDPDRRSGAENEEGKRERELVSSLKSMHTFEQHDAANEFTKHFDPRWRPDRRFLLDLITVGVSAFGLLD